nr:hypothetical protein [Anaerolinea sp.]
MKASITHLRQNVYSAKPAVSWVESNLAILIAAHIALAFLMRSLPALATLHAWLTFAVGVWIALTMRDLRKVIPVAAYITGAEVLWRMTDANVFWEFGKYATIAILGLAFLRNWRWKYAALPLI